jgi:hypothetical protein
MVSVVRELLVLGSRYLAASEAEFAEAAASGDWERAGKAAGEAAELSQALERQERAAGEP